MKQLRILLLISMITLFTTYANASVNMAPIISYLLSDTEPQGEITINDPALKKVIASAFDNTPYSPAIDIQGVIDAGGLTITVPYTVTNAPATLEAYSTSVILDASVTQDDEAGILATFAWTEQTNLPIGSGTFTATITIDDSNTSIPDNTYNAKQLDIEDDSAGLVAATFSYATDNTGGTGVLTLKIVSGIPDRMYGQADNTGNTETHKFLYLPVTNTSTGKTWLNNNLGANYANMNSSVYDFAQQATASNDHNAYGSLFQWGRKADGHELVNWISGSQGERVNGTTTTNSDNPTDALFIGEGSDPYDWRVTQDDTLWVSESSVNNVCPVGYRVPTGGSGGELDLERESWGSNDASGALASTIGMPLPGLGNYTNGTSSYEGENGYYWGSTVYGTQAEYLRISGTDAYDGNSFRAYGFSVRCIKISTEEAEAEAASDAVLAQIGAEGDSGDTVNSVVTVVQLAEILPVITNIVEANEALYQDYIDANPDLFSSLATQAEVQAMVDAVNTAGIANAETSTVTASPETVTADGISTSTVTVTVKDVSSNPVTDATVSLAQTGTSVISEVSNVGDGIYTFMVSSTTAETVTYTATADSVVLTQTSDVTFVATLTASDFNMTLDVNESTVIEDWLTLSSADDAENDPLAALVKTQGSYGTCAITDDSLAYFKTIETNATDSCELEISDGTDTVQITVTINSLYWKQISAGYYHTAAIKSDGTLWGWGDNDYGEVGDGTTISRTVPIQESTAATNWKSVSAGGDHTVALKDDGTLWSWARNTYGQLGDETTTDSFVPIQEITAATNWKSVSAGGYHTVALKTDGTLWAWGYNVAGQLGDGTTTDSLVPIQEITAATNWKSVSAGGSHTAALKTDGTLWSWGSNSNGKLGDGTTIESLVPIQEITAATNWNFVNAGQYHTIALKDDGTLWAWGRNNYGQLGDGTTTDSLVPTQESTAATNWSSADGGGYHTIALRSDGTLWAWGANEYGQLGDSTTTDSLVPTQESTTATNWSSVSAGSYRTVALKSDGTFWGWGYNSNGELGNGTDYRISLPTQENTAATNWSSVSAGLSHTIAIKDDGTLWGWGDNYRGQLGDGTSTDKRVLTQESTAATNWSSVSAGFSHTIAIKEDGTLWGWGTNYYGQLGDGTSTESLVAIQESTAATNWKSVSAGRYYTVAIKDDGTLWAWGDNGDGQLGDGTTTDRSVPTQESTAATNWVSVSVGLGYHTIAIKDDGTLWAWGRNTDGQLGDGTTTNSLVPIQEITAATNWSSVSMGYSYTVALKDEGTLWAWGSNTDGQLGDGTTTNSLVPTQESTAATNWVSVDAESSHTAAIKTDGTLWSWGDNEDRQLGDGTTTTSSVPVQESTAATDWSSVSAGRDYTVAIKDDGMLWGWGYNDDGQTGVWFLVPTLSQPRQP